MARHTIRDELYGVLAFIGFVWCVFIVGHILPFEIESYGVTPRTIRGLIGIPVVPSLHANVEHLVSNTVPLVILLLLLAGSRVRSWAVVTSIVLLSGALLWLFGRPAIHIGASSLVYGLVSYLIVSGIRELRVVPMIISLVVGLLYGGTLAAGILPSSASHVSWEGHLFGAIAGAIIAFWQTKDRDQAVRVRPVG